MKPRAAAGTCLSSSECGSRRDSDTRSGLTCGEPFVSIIRVGLAETKGFDEGWETIFGKKKKGSAMAKSKEKAVKTKGTAAKAVKAKASAAVAAPKKKVAKTTKAAKATKVTKAVKKKTTVK